MEADEIRLEAKVVRVTCLEDRAQVEREGTARLRAGEQVLRIDGFSPVAVDHTVSAKVEGATVVEARVERRWKSSPPGGLPEDASALRRKVHGLERELAAQALEMERLQARLAVEEATSEEVLRGISEEAGANLSTPEVWAQQLGRAREAIAHTRTRIAEVLSERVRRSRALSEAKEALAYTEQPPSVLETALVLKVVAPEPLEAKATVSYLVPCAAWRPAYHARLSNGPDGERVRIECEGVVWQRTGEAWDEVALSLSTARTSLATAPPTLSEERLFSRPKTDEEKHVVEVELREEDIQRLSIGGIASQAMMGVDDGGEARHLRPGAPVTLPSDGRAHRVPLFAFETAARSELLAAPELSPLVSRVARFSNPGPSVLLAGPVELSQSSGYVGRGRIGFAGVGEEVTVAFGSEDGLRLARVTDEQVDESRLTGRKEVLREVRVFVSNASGASARVAVEERIPVSEVEQVRVELLAKKVSPPATATKDGIVRFEVDLGPLARQELVLAYRLSAPAKVSGLT